MSFYSRILSGLVLLCCSAVVAHAQTPVDTLPCDAWLTTLASGVTSLPDYQILYRIDGCERPDSVITAARETGTRSLIARNEIGAMSLYLSYLEQDSTWFANSYVPMILPIVADKSKATELRGQLMLLMATNLHRNDSPVGSVYVVPAGQTPGTSAKCTLGTVAHDRPEKIFGSSSLTTIKSAAQSMVDDSTEVAQLREAAKCLVKAADFAIGN